MRRAASVQFFPVGDYDLAATLTSGQCFNWSYTESGWVGVIQGRWVRMRQVPRGIEAEALVSDGDWHWLTHYLQLGVRLPEVTAAFPPDACLAAAVRACWGLRLLRQDPWECLAAFILSSTKQIVQIEEMVSLLSRRYGAAVAVPSGEPCAHAFPTAGDIAQLSESELRACKMGFRAPYLRETAARIATGAFSLTGLSSVPLETARHALLQLPGVGRKIADCVLLFAYDFPAAFPVDVWVSKALRELYFGGAPVRLKELLAFSSIHFGTYSGYAQQYLFHFMRTVKPPPTAAAFLSTHAS